MNAGPLAQALAIGFRVLSGVTVLLGLAWAASNCRQVPPDAQIVVLRLGRIDRVQQAGLLLAWPQPLERVELLPAPGRPLELAVSYRAGAAGTFLTGDGGAVLLGARLSWRVVDPALYLPARAHVAPALQRLFAAAALTQAAGRSIDDFVVAHPRGGDADAAVQAQRQAVRGELAREVNRRLAALEAAGAGLGVELTRVDLDVTLPAQARPAFDAVLAAGQRAEEGLAAARTQATLRLQTARRDAERLVSEARAAAEERVARARAQVAEVLALQGAEDRSGRAALIERLYRERIAAVLGRAGGVTAVDAQGAARVILPAGRP